MQVRQKSVSDFSHCLNKLSKLKTQQRSPNDTPAPLLNTRMLNPEVELLSFGCNHLTMISFITATISILAVYDLINKSVKVFV